MKVTVERIKRRFPTIEEVLPTVDLRKTAAAFAKARPRALSPDEYVMFLYETGQLDGESVLELHTTAAPIMAEPLVGEVLSDPDSETGYDVLGTLGEGGMGVVQFARDRGLLRNVALKVSFESDSPAMVQRFVTEARITAQLDHPNIIPVYGLEVDEAGQVTYAMKLVEGRSLAQLIGAAGPRPVEPSARRAHLELFLRVCDAMAYAHDRGVIHRDLKPENVMVGAHRDVYVVDWGIARLVDAPDEPSVPERIDLGERDEAYVTQPGTMVGTPAFMSPEQAQGKVLTPASDVFSLGLVLYDLVHLESAYRGKAKEVLLRAASGRLCDPPADSQVETGLLKIIGKATRVEPTSRYDSAGALGDDLRAWLAGDETSAWPDNGPRALKRWLGRHPRVVAAGLVAIVTVFLLLGWYRQQQHELAQATLREQAAKRQHALAGLVGAVEERSRELGAQLHWYEAVVEAIATSATMALHGARVHDGPMYSAAHFASEGQAPPRRAVAGQRAISATHAVHKLSPGVDGRAVDGHVGRLHLLTGRARDLMSHGPHHSGAPGSDAERLSRIHEDAGGLRAVYVGTRSGVFWRFPGVDGGWDDTHDHRNDAWYATTMERFGRTDAPPSGRRHWHAARLDEIDRLHVVSCSQPITDDAGALVAVAGVDVTYERLHDEVRVLEALPGYRETWLLTPTGRVILHSESKHPPHPTLRGPALPESASGLAARSGHALGQDGRTLFIWSHVSPVDWVLLGVFDWSPAD